MLSVLAAAIVHVAITAATLQGLPRSTVSATDEHGRTAQYGGVALRDLLTQQGVPAGEAVRGKLMARYVVVEATDGYRVVFSLPELDPSFTDRVILIADTRDGTALPAAEGPYQLIVPGEKRQARWVRQVTAIDVEDAPEP
jgi:hypothetical protein